MKNKMKLLGIIAFVALIGCGMIACDNGSTSGSKFEGTWLATFGPTESCEYTFTGSDFVLKITRPGELITAPGTFTFTDTTITFTIPIYPDRWTQEYTITGTTLTLFQEPNNHYPGNFQKQ